MTSFDCNICDENFKTECKLKKYILTHVDNRPSFPCKHHQESHSTKGVPYVYNRRKFPCTWPTCKKVLAESSKLKDHMRRHQNARDFACKECPKAFNTKADLRDHMSVMHAEKPFRRYKCEETMCEDSDGFSHPFALKTHNCRYHGRPWDHTCSVCGYTTNYPRDFDLHLRQHNDEKPYHCNLCDEKYANSNSLRYHLQSRHTEKGVQIRKKKEQHCHDWLLKNGFTHVVRNQRVDLRCKEQTATWIELDFYIHRASDDTVFVLELGNHSIFKTF